MDVNRVRYQINALPGDRIYQLKGEGILDRIQAQTWGPLRERVVEEVSYAVLRAVPGELVHHAWTQAEEDYGGR